MRWLNGKLFFLKNKQHRLTIFKYWCGNAWAYKPKATVGIQFAGIFQFCFRLWQNWSAAFLTHAHINTQHTHTLATFCSPINKFMYFVCMHPFKLDSNWPNRWSNNTVASVLVFVRYGWNWVYVTQKEHFENLI